MAGAPSLATSAPGAPFLGRKNMRSFFFLLPPGRPILGGFLSFSTAATVVDPIVVGGTSILPGRRASGLVVEDVLFTTGVAMLLPPLLVSALAGVLDLETAISTFAGLSHEVMAPLE